MHLRYITSISLLVLLIFTSCSTEHSEIILAKYGNSAITMDEFENAYAKNAGGREQVKNDNPEKFRSFLDLYVNFKMKLRDAEVRGYHTDPNLLTELNDYKRQVGVSYILEKDIVEPGIKQLYDRRKWELRVSHLMIRPEPNGDEAALQLITSILDSIKNSESFEEMVEKHTHDQFSIPYGGDIFYVTSGQLPASFEDAAYALNSGEVYPEPVKTQYGYHLIKVTEKKSRIPQIRASHILINLLNSEGEVDSAHALLRLDSLLTDLNNGEDFKTLVERYSDDTGTKTQGGDLGFFERRMMVRPFDEAAFNLEVGEISGVVETNFGYHIIHLTDKKDIPSFEEDKENLKRLFKQTRYQSEYDNLIVKLKKKYNFQIDQATFNFIVDESDSIRLGTVHPKYDEISGMTLFRYADRSVSAGEFFEKIVNETEFVNKFIDEENLTSAINKISNDYILEEEAMNLDKVNPEFAALMDDYKNGIFIFRLQEDEVWNKILIDSVKLYEHYLATRENYKWPDRVEFSEIFVRTDSAAQHIYSLLLEGEDFDTLAVRFTERVGYKEKAGNHGLHAVTSSQIAEVAGTLAEPGNFSEPFKSPGGFSIVRLNSFEPSRIKTFEEAKAEVSGSFQESESKRLENQYLESLKRIYKPVVYHDRVEKAFNE